jgi:hypothetical protein
MEIKTKWSLQQEKNLIAPPRVAVRGIPGMMQKDRQ